MRLVLAITGATGAVYGVRCLEAMARLGVEVHLVVSPAGATTLRHELDLGVADLAPLAAVVHRPRDIAASISSGSFRTDGMLVAPCSVKTLSGIVHAYGENLVVRAADVTLKERRLLVLLFRETPLHLGHLRLLTQAAELGAVVAPPVPAFYNRPRTVEDLVHHTVARALDLFGLDAGVDRWEGLTGPAPAPDEPAGPPPLAGSTDPSAGAGV